MSIIEGNILNAFHCYQFSDKKFHFISIHMLPLISQGELHALYSFLVLLIHDAQSEI